MVLYTECPPQNSATHRLQIHAREEENETITSDLYCHHFRIAHIGARSNFRKPPHVYKPVRDIGHQTPAALLTPHLRCGFPWHKKRFESAHRAVPRLSRFACPIYLLARIRISAAARAAASHVYFTSICMRARARACAIRPVLTFKAPPVVSE